MRIERLEYQAQLAQRRYEEVDPANRLVAATLEQRWNEALQQLKAAQEELEQSRQQQGLLLTEEQKTQLQALAQDLPELWKSPTTSAQDRKRMLRLLIKDITVERNRGEHTAVLHLRWQGGAAEDLHIALPLPAPDKVRYPQPIVERIRLLAESLQDPQIAAALNQEGLVAAKGGPFTTAIIKWVRCRHQIPPPSLRKPEELTVSQVTQRLGVSLWMVYYWIERGHLPARRLGPGNPYWITLTPEKETQLRNWIAQSGHLKRRRSPNSVEPDAL
jgi:excisionase family DNA binding protein